MRRDASAWAWLLPALSLALAACAGGPIGAVRAAPADVHRELTANALTAGRPSTGTRNVLFARNLRAAFAARPAEALAALHRQAAGGDDPDALFALAELSFLHAEAETSRAHFLAAAVYAYAFLFPEGAGPAPDRFDPRLRLAADLYNRALARGLASDDGAEVLVRDGSHALPFGALEVDFDPLSLWVGDRKLDRFVAVAELAVRGLETRYRRFGLGAPLAASTVPADPGRPVDDFVAAVKVPVTALLRIEGARRGLAGGRLRATLDLYRGSETEWTEIAGERVPLELEPTAALAATLEGAPVWREELRAFTGSAARGARPVGLVSITPYRPGLIPIVFVHGTASSAVRWAEMFNRLDADPRIRERFQFWFFSYDSANPIPYSAMLMRSALRSAVARLDPDGRDPALRRMVLIGHSQGGLLVKMQAIRSGSRFWDRISRRPLEEMPLSPETREVFRQALFVEPAPFVGRVVFISTPHRGSFVAGRPMLGTLIRAVVSFPARVLAIAAELAANRAALAEALLGQPEVSSAVDNMSPRHLFIQTLQTIPVADEVPAHSIISVAGDGPVESGDDGVVAYASAHVPGVDSERVVRSGHSTQGHPETIAEVHRILLLHAAGR